MNLMSHCQNRALLVWMMVWLCCYGYVFCYLVVSVGLSLEAHVSQVHNLLQCLCLSVCVWRGRHVRSYLQMYPVIASAVK